LFDYTGECIGITGISIFSNQYEGEKDILKKSGNKLLETSKNISKELGYIQK